MLQGFTEQFNATINLTDIFYKKNYGKRRIVLKLLGSILRNIV